MARRRSDSSATADVRAALRLRFEARAWALFEEVGNATGAKCDRHADAIAMSLWPSRGLHLHGVEIKADRADWLRELKDPAKADAIAAYCDFWWVAVANDGIVRAGELPGTWGLLVLTGDKLVCKTDAKLLEAKPIDRSFLAALLRRAASSVPDLVNEAELRGFERGAKEGPAEHQLRLASAEDDLERMRASVAEFEKKSGILINAWNGGNIGEAVNRLLRTYQVDPVDQLDHAANNLETRAAQLRQAAEEMRSAKKKLPPERRAAAE